MRRKTKAIIAITLAACMTISSTVFALTIKDDSFRLYNSNHFLKSFFEDGAVI